MLKDITVLFVEDVQFTHELMKLLLEDDIKELYLASNGKEGLEVYKDKNPDVILTDIGMPIMDGIEMSREIKRLNPNQLIAVITAFNEKSYMEEAKKIGIDKYILKPIEKDSIFGVLESFAS
ncbi:MAG: response regulator [Sulfurovum sp.]